jgi:flavodoxin I
MEMGKIALLYAPAKGNTEKIARIIQKKIGENKIELMLVQENTDPKIVEPYNKLIFGISTVGRDSWDSKYKKVGWDTFLPKLEKIELKGKTVAIFGLGDHILYSQNFVDSMGVLANQLIKAGAALVGNTPTLGYTFSNSEAIIDNQFVGLPIDEDNEPELSERRIDSWIEMISVQMDL